jgi:hypothetical protein
MAFFYGKNQVYLVELIVVVCAGKTLYGSENLTDVLIWEANVQKVWTIFLFLMTIEVRIFILILGAFLFDSLANIWRFLGCKFTWNGINLNQNDISNIIFCWFKMVLK